MKKKWKKVISTGLVCALAGSMLAGCGGNGADTSKPSADSTQVESDAAQTKADGAETENTDAQDEGKASGEVIELRWLSSQIGESSEAEWFSGVVEGFNKEYEGRIKINVDGVAGEGAQEKLRTDAAGNTMPDLFTLNADASRFDLIADAEVAVDLTPYMEANPELWDRVDKESAEAYTDDQGRLLGMPYARSYIGIFYNEDLLGKAGVTEIPATWDEFFDACDKIKASGVYPNALMTGENSWTTMLMLTFAMGSTPEGQKWLLETTPDTANFNNPAFIEAVEKLQVMLKDYATADAVGASYAVTANNFMNGQAAIISNGPWMIPEFSNPETAMEGLAENVRYAIGPDSSVVRVENISYGIGSKDPEKIEAAFEVLKYLARDEVYAEFLNISGNTQTISLDESLLEMNEINAEFIPEALEAEYQFTQFSNCVKAAVNDGLGQLLPSLADGSMTPEDFAAELQKISDAN